MLLTCRDYSSMANISTLVRWQALVSHTYLKVPECTALLQSLLEIEVIWKLSVVRNTRSLKSVPMLQKLLTNGHRYAPCPVAGRATLIMPRLLYMSWAYRKGSQLEYLLYWFLSS